MSQTASLVKRLDEQIKIRAAAQAAYYEANSEFESKVEELNTHCKELHDEINSLQGKIYGQLRETRAIKQAPHQKVQDSVAHKIHGLRHAIAHKLGMKVD